MKRSARKPSRAFRVVNDENGWRDGPAGFGYYRGDYRVDGGRDENLEQAVCAIAVGQSPQRAL